MIQDVPVKEEAPLPLNTCQGIVFSVEATVMAQQELMEMLVGEFHIVSIKKIKQKLDKNSCEVILNFATP